MQCSPPCLHRSLHLTALQQLQKVRPEFKWPFISFMLFIFPHFVDYIIYVASSTILLHRYTVTVVMTAELFPGKELKPRSICPQPSLSLATCAQAGAFQRLLVLAVDGISHRCSLELASLI